MNWLSVEDRLYLVCMIFKCKISKNMLPSYFNQFIIYNSSIHNHNTRNNENLLSMNSVFFKGLNEFNILPASIKNSTNVYTFKNQLLIAIKCRKLSN